MISTIQQQLSRSYTLLIKDMASKIVSINDDNFGEIQFLITEMQHLSRCFKWTDNKEPVRSNHINHPNKNMQQVAQNQICHFCNQVGHKVKNCQIFQKSKMKKKLKKQSAEVNQIASNFVPTKIALKDQCVQATQNFENKETQKYPTMILKYEKYIQTIKNDRSISIQTAASKQNYFSKFSQTNFPTFSSQKSSQIPKNVNVFRGPTANNLNRNKFENSRPNNNFRSSEQFNGQNFYYRELNNGYHNSYNDFPTFISSLKTFQSLQ